MKTGWKKTIAPLVLVLGAVALAACGGSDDDDSADTAAGTGAAAAPSGETLIIGTDLPLQGASADASADTNNAIKLLLEQMGGKAGTFTIEIKEYDNSTAAKGGWDDATCAKNANDHVANKAEVAVMGTYNSGCAKIEIPVLNQDPTRPDADDLARQHQPRHHQGMGPGRARRVLPDRRPQLRPRHRH